MVVQAKVAGPLRSLRARLVVDTGAAATTLTPEVVATLGYSRRDGYKRPRFTPLSGRSMATGCAWPSSPC